MQTININVNHVTRLEGHGNIVVRAKDGVLLQNEWQIPEAPRFFEAMVRGRQFEDIQTVVSRICGICSVSHSLAAVKAIEDAMKVEISPQTDKLRLLLHYGEQIESHALHVGYLVAPDLLGLKSVVPLATSRPEIVKTVIQIHRVGNTIMERLGGRKTHPVRVRTGGFSMLPTEDELYELRELLENSVPRVEGLMKVVDALRAAFPDFSRETEYVALTDPPNYTFYHGSIGSTDTDERVPVHEFERVTNEYVVAQSTAKWARWHRESYFVGSLARLKLNHEFLQPAAKNAAARLGWSPDCTNPYFNNVAQVVELVEAVARSIKLVDELLADGIRPEEFHVEPRAGEGVGCVEAPRGILFHRYAFDESGICTKANIAIPTNQNHGNIQKDLEALVPTVLDRGQNEIRHLLEMLVRSYDPCISCSTHYLDITFV